MTGNPSTRLSSGRPGEVPELSRPAPEWTVELPAGLPLINANQRLHWSNRAARTRDLRLAAFVAARNAGIPALGRVHVTAEYRPPDRRRRDVHNLYPSAKAAIDGLVDAGVIEDDSDEYLTGPDMRAGDPIAKGQLILHIRGVA